MVDPDDVTWWVMDSVLRGLQPLRQQWGEVGYRAQVASLRLTLCSIFSSEAACQARLRTFAQVGTYGDGGKVLKMRWAYPGCGKSGGLRLVLVAYCDAKRVDLVHVVQRKQGLSTTEVADALGKYGQR